MRCGKPQQAGAGHQRMRHATAHDHGPARRRYRHPAPIPPAPWPHVRRDGHPGARIAAELPLGLGVVELTRCGAHPRTPCRRRAHACATRTRPTSWCWGCAGMAAYRAWLQGRSGPARGRTDAGRHRHGDGPHPAERAGALRHGARTDPPPGPLGATTAWCRRGGPGTVRRGLAAQRHGRTPVVVRPRTTTRSGARSCACAGRPARPAGAAGRHYRDERRRGA